MKKLILLALISTLGAQTPVQTGTIQFLDSGTLICTVTLPSTTCSTSSLSVGTHNITAVYSGDSVYAGSTSAILTQIVKAPLIQTTSTLTGAPNPSTVGQAVVLTNTISHQ